jgi:hypothetical protein
MENTTLATGTPLPVLSQDQDWVHMMAMTKPMDEALQAGNLQLASTLLAHFSAHYVQGLAKKLLPSDRINDTKSFIASYERKIKDMAKQQLQLSAEQLIAMQGQEMAGVQSVPQAIANQAGAVGQPMQ